MLESIASGPKNGCTARISVPGVAARRAVRAMVSVIDREVLGLTTRIFMPGLRSWAADQPAGRMQRVDVTSAQPCPADHPVQRAPGVRGDRLLVVQSLRTHDEPLVRGEHAQVCVMAGGD